MTDAKPYTDIPPVEWRISYAEESHRMALAMWDLIFPPWRWPRWFRQYREVKRRLKQSREWREAWDREHGR